MADERSISHTGSTQPKPDMPHSQRPMTPQQAADFLGLDDKTITRWARNRYLPAHPMGEGKKKYWRFFEHELLAWLRGQSDVGVTA